MTRIQPVVSPSGRRKGSVYCSLDKVIVGSLKEPGSALAKGTKELIYQSQRRAFALGAVALDLTGGDFTLLPKMHFGSRGAAVRTCEVVDRRIGVNRMRPDHVEF